MIVEWLMSLGAGIVSLFTGMLPDWKVPDSVLHLDQTIDSLFTTLNGVGVWVNWTAVSIMAGIPIALWGLGTGFKLLMWAWSKVPVVGGK